MELRQLEAERDATTSELTRLGDLIAAKKEALPANAEPGAELTGLLRASTLLAGKLTELQARIATAEAELRAVGQGAVPAPPAPAQVRPTAGDDARSLREKADFLRDREDALRQRLAAIGRRIAALERERQLARRVSELAREQELFDDEDRRVAVTQSEYSTAGVSPSQGQVANRPGGAETAMGGGGAPNGAGGSNTDTNGQVPASTAQLAPGATEASGQALPGARQSATGERPEDLQAAGADDGDPVDSLRAQAEALRREADELHRSAQALDRTAATGR